MGDTKSLEKSPTSTWKHVRIFIALSREDSIGQEQHKWNSVSRECMVLLP